CLNRFRSGFRRHAVGFLLHHGRKCAFILHTLLVTTTLRGAYFGKIECTRAITIFHFPLFIFDFPLGGRQPGRGVAHPADEGGSGGSVGDSKPLGKHTLIRVYCARLTALTTPLRRAHAYLFMRNSRVAPCRKRPTVCYGPPRG